MKVEPDTFQRIKAQAACYQEFLKDWLEPANLQRLRPQLEFQTGILAGFALLASVLLGVTNCSTEGTIQQRLDEDLVKSLEEVVPAAIHDNDMIADALTIPSAGKLQVYRAGWLFGSYQYDYGCRPRWQYTRCSCA
jgi:Na+-translocating ferredoxin:NAD+ oxidoreductase subunit G